MAAATVSPDERWLVAEIERIDPKAYENVHLGSVERALGQLVIELRDELLQLRDLVTVAPAADPWLDANVKGSVYIAPAADVATPRTDAQIVEQTEMVAALLAEQFDGSAQTEGATYREAAHPNAQRCWKVACRLQELLTDTDVQNAVAELEG